MISAWDVYWVMQLDSVGGLFTFLAFAGAMASGFSAMLAWASDKDVPAFAYRTGVAFVAAAMLATFTPSSKTAAAMIVLPAITSDKAFDAVAPEARELYSLAKDALRSLSEKEPAEKAK